MRAVLFHEYTHVLIAQLTGGNIPTWLNEGLAEFEGGREFSQPLLVLQHAQSLLPLGTLAGSFASMDGQDASLAYQQSSSLATYLVNKYGWYVVRSILKSLGEKESVETAFSKSLSDWSLDLPGFIKEWLGSLSRSAPGA